VNTLIAGNHKASLTSMGQEDDCNGALLSGGFNLIQDPTGCSISGSTAGDVTGQDPLLGPLRFHGGPTKTRALLPGSPALDAGQTPACLDAASDTLTTDQRGSARPYGTRCDIGAYEAPEPGAAALGGATLATLLAWSRVRSRAPARG
jgi:hypothetical protein